jgi:hypothetical protein
LQEEEKWQKKLHEEMRKEEVTWRLKSRCLWLQEGDKNTSYFHKKRSVRKGQNTMKEIHLRDNSTLSSF